MTEQLNDLQAEISPAQDLPIETPEALEAIAPPQPNGFVQLGLADELVRAVADLGYTQPTAVQTRAIPLALDFCLKWGHSPETGTCVPRPWRAPFEG